MGAQSARPVATPGFVVQQESVVQNSGRQIDWARVPDALIVPATGKKAIPAGTAMGQLASGKIVPRVEADAEAVPAVVGVPAIGLLLTNAIEGDRSAALTGYGVMIGGVVFTELLPAVLDEDTITELQAAGTGFAFEHYADDRVS